MEARGLGLFPLVVVPAAGWVASVVIGLRSYRKRRARRGRRLEALGGRLVGDDRVAYDDGTEVQIYLRPDERVELWIRSPVPELAEDSQLRTAGNGEPPSLTILHLALAREKLLRLDLTLRAQSGRLEVGQLSENLPSAERVNELAGRVRRATASAREGRDLPAERLKRDVVRGLIDKDPSVRLSAALVAGSLGWTVLAQLVGETQLSEQERLDAVRALQTRAPITDVVPVLMRAAESSPKILAAHCVDALASLNPDGLARLLVRKNLDSELAVRAVKQLEDRSEDPESVLLDVLPRTVQAAQRVILERLAAFGGPKTHAALDELLSRGGLGVRLDGPLRRVVRATAARYSEIQGALSEVEATGSDVRGALSEPKKG